MTTQSEREEEVRIHKANLARNKFTHHDAMLIAQKVSAVDISDPSAFDRTVNNLMRGTATPEDFEQYDRILRVKLNDQQHGKHNKIIEHELRKAHKTSINKAYEKKVSTNA